MDPVRIDFSMADLAMANQANLNSVYRLMHLSARNRVEDTEQILRVESTVPHSMLNMVLQAQFAESDARAEVGRIVDRYRGRAIPWVWEVGPGTQPDEICAYLEGCGLGLRYTMPGMALELAALSEIRLETPGVTIEEVTDAQALSQWSEVCIAGFAMPRDVIETMAACVTEAGFGEQAPMRCFLALQDGRPVACSALHLAAGVAGLYCVATISECRKQGLGALVTAYPLQIASALGYSVGILQASRMGFSIYQRLGFVECCQFKVYASMD